MRFSCLNSWKNAELGLLPNPKLPAWTFAAWKNRLKRTISSTNLSNKSNIEICYCNSANTKHKISKQCTLHNYTMGNVTKISPLPLKSPSPFVSWEHNLDYCLHLSPKLQFLKPQIKAVFHSFAFPSLFSITILNHWLSNSVHNRLLFSQPEDNEFSLVGGGEIFLVSL